jgi:hypothetical protein
MTCARPAWLVGSLLAILFSGLLFSGRCARQAAAQQSRGGVQWRRTVDGWERADGWLVEVQVGRKNFHADSSRSRFWPTVHPAIFAALQLVVSCGALAAFRPKLAQTRAHGPYKPEAQAKDRQE